MKWSWRFSNEIVCSLALAALYVLASGTKASAQDLTGEIDGRVIDSSGAAVPNASVIVKNDDQNSVARTLQTNAQGQFTASLLPLAHYTVTVSATGFRGSATDVDVHTGTTSSANFSLAPGTVSESVTVTTDVVIEPQLENSAAGTLIPSTKISELSLSSRNFLQLVGIQPGVSGNIPGGVQDRGSISSSGGVNAANYEVNGIPAQYNGFFLDGQDLQRRSAGGTQIGAYPGIDFIQEINLQRSNFGAQLGGSGSAFVSIASKSGSTAFHGTAYEFYRSQIFNANTYLNKLAGVPRPGSRYSNFGYEVGGPIWIPGVTKRENAKTFFVAGQEFLRSVVSSPTTLQNVPTAQQRMGIFTVPICVAYTGATCKTSSTTIANIDPTAQAYLNDVINKTPVPNNPNDPQGVITSEPGTNNETQTFVRIDRRFTDKFSVFFRFFNDPFSLRVPYGLRTPVQAPGVGTADVTNGSRAYFGAGTYVLSPSNVLQAGGGYVRSYVTAQAVGSLLASNSPDVHPTLPYATQLGRIPNLNIGGGSYSTISPYKNGNPQTQVFANDTQVLGRNTLSAGFNLEWTKAGNNTATLNAGAYTFRPTTLPAGTPSTAQFSQAFANFLLGNVQSFQQTNIDPSVFVHANVYEGYIQDDFHALPSLTVNLGLRYEYFATPSSATLKGGQYMPFSNFDPSRYSAGLAPTIGTDGTICRQLPCSGGVIPNPNYSPTNGIIIANLNSPFGSKVYSQPRKAFAPRLGFSYDLGGKGRTAIRGGYGIYYLQVTTAPAGQLGANQPFVQNLLVTNTNFGNPASTVVNGNPSPQAFKAAGINTHPPYVQAYSLDVQRSIFGSVIVDVGYYGNRALHLPLTEDINQPVAGSKAAVPGIGGTGAVNATNTPSLNQIRPYLGYGPINAETQSTISNYNSLQTSITKRFRTGSLITGNYTYSRALTNSFTPQNIYNTVAEYGPDAASRTNLFNVNFVYIFPYFKNERSLKGYTLGGWELTGIAGVGSGQFLTVTNSGVDPAGQGLLATGATLGVSRPDYVSNPNDGAPHSFAQWFNTAAFANVPTGQFRAGTASNGSVKGPGYANLDASVFKNLPLGAERSLQLRFESFNVLNHTNYANIFTNKAATGFGGVATTGPARVLQVAAKVRF